MGSSHLANSYNLEASLKQYSSVWKCLCNSENPLLDSEAEEKDLRSSSPPRTPKLQLAAEPPLTGERWISPKKNTPMSQGKEEALTGQQGGKTAFRIKPHTCQSRSEGANKTLRASGPRKRNGDPHKRLSQTCLRVSEPFLRRHGSALACPEDRALAAADWGVWHLAKVLLEEVSISPTTEPPSRGPTDWRTIIPKKFSHCCKSYRAHNRLPNLGIRRRDWEPPGNLTLEASEIWLQSFHRAGKQTLKGTNKTLCPPEPRRKEQGPHRRLSQTCLWMSRSLQWKRGSTVACHGVRDTEYNSPGGQGVPA